uniref:Uncharacterized protein n=1 Tax=Entomoneis paludosa TaxID=265537 RepID=A0A7S2VAC1_9STRA|mmetsp:Transcript_10451/g.21481  ORF Transcript_10451/g.21481 Transcript_10451/m.21481 type:complete len:337 (+) Transcript_10451:302-1312(+)|eukprot:CAMPEP_0172454572 /NCGR_PEP_ID=MMETSP1065-20121228/11519_1 /TAXON_ID=265537 /ORGANISM="Amphiprora paludosa, Strain CCMP125" /LENGTH=336 /DNA_ID=CAMNT_0013206921 /DNA_START=286 /DNA_END=1296 /DNA_ORIENTATION=+
MQPFQPFDKSYASWAKLLLVFHLWAAVVESIDPITPKGGHSPQVTSHSFEKPPNSPCHYSSIGFETPWSTDHMIELSKSFARNPSTKMYTPAGNAQEHGCLLHLSTQNGAEMWGAVERGSFLGMDPHYCGLSRVPMRLTEKKWDDSSNAAAFVGTTVMEESDNDSGDDDAVMMPMTLEFDCPYSFFANDLVEMPQECTVQLAAFAHEIAVFDRLEDYKKHCQEVKARGDMAFADRSFFWTAIFHDDEEEEDSDKRPPRSNAIMTGHVVQSEVKLNEQTGEYFYWALVETVGGRLDVVIHPHLIDRHGESPPRVGCILQGHFWLSGRLVDLHEKFCK